MANKNIEANKVISNIYALAKLKSIKIGALEQEAGVSIGYLSRLNKKGNTTLPSVEILYTIAERLGVTIDMLLSSDVSEMTKGELFLLSFIEKVLQDTIDEDLEWRRETKKELNDFSYIYNDGVPHPLFVLDAGMFTYGALSSQKYQSFFGDVKAEIAGDCFNASLPYADALLYVMHVVYVEENGTKLSNPLDEIEIYIVKNGEVEPLSRSYKTAIELEEEITRLYKTIQELKEHAGISKRTRYILDCYIKGEQEIPV